MSPTPHVINETLTSYRRELEEMAYDHADGVGEPLEDVKETLSTMNTLQLEKRLIALGYDLIQCHNDNDDNNNK